MTPPLPDYVAIRLATDPVSPRDRMAFCREVFGRKVFNLELEPDPDIALRMDFHMRALPGLKLVTGAASGVRSRRTSAQLADSNDDLFLSINNEAETFFIGQRGREVALGMGDAVLTTCAEPSWFRRAHGLSTGISVPRSMFAHLSPSIEDRVGCLIPRHTEALRLLRGYVAGLDRDISLATPELRHLATSHVHDLLTLSVDTIGDSGARQGKSGLKAARLRAIKSFVAEQLLANDLSVATAAGAHSLTERYVQRLFEAEGTTFSTFVNHQRLARVHRLLRDPRLAHCAVSTIAYECGFGDVSHFNRMFRRLYGCSPSDVRAIEGGFVDR